MTWIQVGSGGSPQKMVETVPDDAHQVNLRGRRQELKRQSTQDTGTALPIKHLVCPLTSSKSYSGMAAGDSKLKTLDPILSYGTSVSKYTSNILPVPEELGNCAAWVAR